MNNSKIGWRTVVVLAVLAISIWSFWPTVRVHSLSGQEKTDFIKNNPKVFKGAINFGLDLAGGTHVVVEIDTTGLKVRDGESRAEALQSAQEQSLEIVRNRVDQFGLSEPVIAKSGENRIVADLAGVDAEQARGLLGETAQLEFKLVVTRGEFLPVLNRIDAYLSQKAGADTSRAAEAPKSEAPAAAVGAGLQLKSLDEGDSAKTAEAAPAADSSAAVAAASDSAAADSSKPAETLAQFRARPFGGRFVALGNDLAIPEADVEAVRAALADPGVQALIPLNIQFALGRGWEKMSNGDKVKRFYALKRRAEMGGTEIVDAVPYRISDGMQAGEVAVNLKFDGLGAKKFATVTGNNIKRQLAIVLDDQVVSAPVIQTRIPNGNAQITGLDDFNEAKQLAVVLRAGALPLPMTIGELRSVGATLGEDNIRSGMNAALVGLALVAVFMVAYYRKTGLWAVIALAFNMLLIGAVMSTFHAVLTMPGIAGIVLTIGMAVDANVIIYERIREELRLGRTVRMAIQAGYEKATSAIVDANVTTLLTAFILYKIGSGPIKGFGLTLMIGIVASMFTALYVTRWLFMLTGDTRSDGTKLSIGQGILKNPNLPIVPNAKKGIAISLALIVVSFGLFFTRGLNYGIDFTGGNVLTVAFQQETTAEQISKAVSERTALGTPTVRTVDVLDKNTPTFLVSIMKTVDDGAVVPAVEKALADAGAPGRVINEELVGPAIGKQLKSSAAWAIFWSLLVMIAYIWFRFGKFGLGFGLGAVIALAHDVVLTLGFFAATGISLDSTMIAALLTIVGYSINDTIVIYDRVRENTQIMGKESFAFHVNNSINQCLGRSIWTSVTTLLVTVTLVLFGGISIHDFSLAMTVGVVVGFWSTTFIATQFVIWWTGRYGIKGRKA